MVIQDDAAARLDRFRVAMKFTLWAWAFYWPGGGMLLLFGGLDVVSIIVTVASFGTFLALAITGALSTRSSRNMREFLLERPMYLVAALILLILTAPLFTPVEHLGLLLFSTVLLAAMVLATVRLVQYVRADGRGVFENRTDQTFIALGLVAFAALVIFLDAWVTLLGGSPVSGPPTFVAIVNWINLVYPPMLLLATRPIREPLQWPRRKQQEPDAPEASAEEPVRIAS